MDAAHSYRVRFGPYLVSCDPARLDIDYLFAFLSTAYWHHALTPERLARSIAYSINFGLYDSAGGDRQVGFARTTGDRTTFAYLDDVFIDAERRGAGLGGRLMEAVHSHPELGGLKRWALKTRDAHGFYGQFGYVMVGGEGGFMTRTP